MYERKSIKAINEALHDIAHQLELISISMERLQIIFFDKNWALKESYVDSLKIRQETMDDIDKHLKLLQGSIDTLQRITSRTLNREITVDGIDIIQRWVNEIRNKHDKYLNKVKNRLPPLSDQISQLKRDIVKINGLLGQIDANNLVIDPF